MLQQLWPSHSPTAPQKRPPPARSMESWATGTLGPFTHSNNRSHIDTSCAGVGAVGLVLHLGKRPLTQAPLAYLCVARFKRLVSLRASCSLYVSFYQIVCLSDWLAARFSILSLSLSVSFYLPDRARTRRGHGATDAQTREGRGCRALGTPSANLGAWDRCTSISSAKRLRAVRGVYEWPVRRGVRGVREARAREVRA